MRTSFLKGLACALILAGAVGATSADAAVYKVDGVHSSALFKVQHFGVSNFYGMFTDIQGEVRYDPASPAEMGVKITIAAASVDTRAEGRDDHVKSPDFLNAAEFPTIRFESTKVAMNEDGTFAVTGNLTLHGVTREIQVTAEKVGEGTHPRSGKALIGFETRFIVDRTEFDMGFMAGPLSEEVEFLLSLEAGL